MACEHGTAVRRCKICTSKYNKNYGKVYREGHKEERKEYNRKYYLTNIEIHKQRGKLWREANKEKIKKIKREQYIANRLKVLEQQKVHNQLIKKQVMGHYSQGELKCAHCGFSNIDALCIDHIKGRGNKHREEIGGGARFYHWLVKNHYPDGLQILCYNCNWLKRLEQQAPIQVKNAKKNETTKAYFLRMKTTAFQHYSKSAIPICNLCGNDDLRVLSIDHIAGNGSKERKEIGYGSTFYIWLVKNNFPKGYQILCLNCQMIKRAENNKDKKSFSSMQFDNSMPAISAKRTVMQDGQGLL